MQQRQLQDRQNSLPIQSRPDTAIQTQPPRQGFYRDQPRDNPWRGGDNRPPVVGHPGGHGDGWGSGPRYRPGYEIDRIPGGYSRVPYRGNDYFYSGGYWYRPQGPRYVVVEPPRGVRVRYLPDYAQQVWLGSALFFLAAGTYYSYEQSTQEYVVAEPPQGVEPVYSPEQPVQQGSPYEVLAYPANGQGEQQIAQDRYDCYQYAIQQSNFDPSTATYQPAPEVVGLFRQAMAGCYAGRGYSVQQ
ncbi:glycine zipper family protein [Pseudomonas sp. RIT412]|nr:glycine zipper family protein [Pseudomonas sp. RIT 412]